MYSPIIVRDLHPGEHDALGKLMVRVYERIGFARAEELDFLQEGFPVYGFRLRLEDRG